MSEDTLREYVRKLIIEAKRVREVDTSSGVRVPFASKQHVKDLKSRIDNLVYWRDKEKKGTEARANYSRLINKLKAQLKSALKRIPDKN